MNAERTDEELMVAYREGDAAAFRTLFERYAPRLQRWLHHWVFSDELARDLVQQTFLQVHRARFDYRPQAPLRPWIVTIARNLAREQGRRKLRRPEDTGRDALIAQTETAGDPAHRFESGRDLQRALGILSDGAREVVWLHWIEGLSYEEIGEVLGIKAGAVRVRAHRAYASLRAWFESGNGLVSSGILEDE